jgi:hypothetical protein
LVADIVAHLNVFLFELELFATAIFQDHLALLVGALVFFAPFLVLLDV